MTLDDWSGVPRVSKTEVESPKSNRGPVDFWGFYPIRSKVVPQTKALGVRFPEDWSPAPEGTNCRTWYLLTHRTPGEVVTGRSPE